jgi:hypothetical protein
MQWNQRDFESVAQAAEAAHAAFEAEQERLSDLGRAMAEESTTVWAKGRQLSMTFDGRGELTGITFHGTKFRQMAPAELAHTLVQTMREGREQALAKLNSFMGSSVLPGVDFVELAHGEKSPKEIFDSLFSPILNEFTNGDPDCAGTVNVTEKGKRDG